MGFEELLWRLKTDYPELKFRAGARFLYRPRRTIQYEQFLRDERAEAVQAEQGAADGAGLTEQKNDGGRELAQSEQKYCLQLLHEVGHALCKHFDYATDLERIKIERSAWDKAQQLCDIYNIAYDEDFVEGELDTYRDWLQRKSVCPECGLVRYQDKRGVYHCPRCEMLGVVPRRAESLDR